MVHRIALEAVLQTFLKGSAFKAGGDKPFEVRAFDRSKDEGKIWVRFLPVRCEIFDKLTVKWIRFSLARSLRFSSLVSS